MIEDGAIPTVPHLHGGHNESASDGLPEAWFTQRGPGERGADFEKRVFTYDNSQEGATLWYHDHALGITRLNVYAGLAGFYLLEGEQREALAAEGVLPALEDTLQMAIQDRAFTADGQLYYPAFRDDPLPGTDETVGDMVPEEFYEEVGEDAPSALPEFFGDVLLVNGMAWPVLEVGAGEIQVDLLNGSDSRFYLLELDNPFVRATLVGTDGGLLPSAVEIADGDGVQEAGEFLVLAPGDRVNLVLDFGALEDGEAVTLVNRGPAYEPFKGLDYGTGELAGDSEAATAEDPVGAVMRFAVDGTLAAPDVSVEGGTVLNAAYRDLTAETPDAVRKLGLFEGEDEFDRIQPLLGTAEEGALHSDKMTPDGAFGPLLWDAPTTETPELGTTEQWDIFNFTEDAHPIHLHLVQYQVVQKLAFDFEDEDENGIPDDGGDGSIEYGYASAGQSLADPDVDVIVFDDAPLPVRPEDEGWQDTVWVGPREMLSVVAEFDRPGDYVWHCHILSHEDHEMMRRFEVQDDLVA